MFLKSIPHSHHHFLKSDPDYFLSGLLDSLVMKALFSILLNKFKRYYNIVSEVFPGLTMNC